jgi:hypothetical protein
MGTVTFPKEMMEVLWLPMQLSGTSSGGSHPAHIHASSATQGWRYFLIKPIDGKNR